MKDRFRRRRRRRAPHHMTMINTPLIRWQIVNLALAFGADYQDFAAKIIPAVRVMGNTAEEAAANIARFGTALHRLENAWSGDADRPSRWQR